MTDFLNTPNANATATKSGGTKQGDSCDARNATRRTIQYLNRCLTNGQAHDGAWCKEAKKAIVAMANLYGATLTSEANPLTESNQKTINELKNDCLTVVASLDAKIEAYDSMVAKAKAKKAKAKKTTKKA